MLITYPFWTIANDDKSGPRAGPPYAAATQPVKESGKVVSEYYN